MVPAARNLFSDVPRHSEAERVEPLFDTACVRVERIVSTGQASPPGHWYDQAWAEWVVVLAGSAGVLVEGEREARVLRPGDHLHVAAHVRHRVEWTSPDEPTVWLAVHHR